MNKRPRNFNIDDYNDDNTDEIDHDLEVDYQIKTTTKIKSNNNTTTNNFDSIGIDHHNLHNHHRHHHHQSMPSSSSSSLISSSSSIKSNSWDSKISELNNAGFWDYTIELNCIRGPEDLQLAAELGKTLLERNKELETTLKHHQNVIDDQAQEIEYLQKQTAALREVNDSRLRIYEQLEVGIQDLERANHRLLAENAADKKQIKSLQVNIENLEVKCEELNKNLEETKKSLSAEKRKTDRLLQQERANTNEKKEIERKSSIDEIPIECEDADDKKNSFERLLHDNDDSIEFVNHHESTIVNSANINDAVDLFHKEDNEEVIRLLTELETTKKALLSEQQRVSELEEQLVTIIQENQSLQSRIAQTGSNEEMRSVHDELSILEEVRQGTMCSRCLRSVNDKSVADDNLSILESEGEIDDGNNTPATVAAESKSNVAIKDIPKPATLDLNQTPPLSSSSSTAVNPYRQLVEKYEALLEVHRHSTNRLTNRQQQQQQNTCLSDDAQTSGEFNSINAKENLDEVNINRKHENLTIENNTNHNSKTNNESNSTINRVKKHSKISRRTPTDFSETETLSSGFSDELSHKATQTDERQGYFLCSIGDGEDCKFSIYDDVSPIDSRFRNRPEYRELFKEIFAVLKKAAENKEEGENLPLLDDNCPNKVPPVTPANEDPPSFCDDTQSVISSAFSEQSVAISECVTKIERKTAKKHLKGQDKSQLRGSCGSFQATTPTNMTQITENGRVLTPLKREPLEYVQVGVGVKKKNRRKHRNASIFEFSESTILPSPPKVYYNSGKKRKDIRPYIPNPNVSNQTPTRSHPEWSGHSMVIYNRNMQSLSPSSPLSDSNVKSNHSGLQISNFEYKPSTVSQDLHKLKKLDLSYAEVLRRADACKHHHRK